VYSPDCLREDGPLDIPRDLLPLTARALDRVVAEDSEWCELWEESGRFADVSAVLAPIRAAVTDE
jgi:Domain of unknown function (DUF4259)